MSANPGQRLLALLVAGAHLNAAAGNILSAMRI